VDNKIFYIVYCLFLCLFVRIRISPPSIKLAASHFAQRFIGVKAGNHNCLWNLLHQKLKIGRIGQRAAQAHPDVNIIVEMRRRKLHAMRRSWNLNTFAIYRAVCGRRIVSPFTDLFIIRPHRMHYMDAAYCYIHPWMFVCVSVCEAHGGAACAIEMPFGGWLTHVGHRNHVLDRVNIPHGKRQCWGLSGPLKSTGSLCCGVVYAAKGIIQSTITAWQCDCCNRLQCFQLVCHVKLFPVKIPIIRPLRCGLSSKFFWPLCFTFAPMNVRNFAMKITQAWCNSCSKWK